MTDARDRALGAFVGLAVGDALGAPVEFMKRGTFPHIMDMHAGGYFRLPAGAWTDDTAMALCLADSLLHAPMFDPQDLLNRFLLWIDGGENTSTGHCVGIGQNTFEALINFRKTGVLEAPKLRKLSDGNGALMRLAPVACMHWQDEERAVQIAEAQSATTHYSSLSKTACSIAARLMSRLIAGQPWNEARRFDDLGDIHPEIFALLEADLKTIPEDNIQSSGYVIHTFEAALWAVETSSSFEEALIKAVNLGDDADTVGAVAGQLAGALYGYSNIPERWLKPLAHAERIQQAAHDLYLIGANEGARA